MVEGGPMSAERIVQALAACTAPEGDHGGCALCSGSWPAEARFDDMAWHEPGCPWRLAREWVTTGREAARVVLGREVMLWRSVFGPASLEQLAHLDGCLSCTPVCGHEEYFCPDYYQLDTSVAQKMGDDAARRALRGRDESPC